MVKSIEPVDNLHQGLQSPVDFKRTRRVLCRAWPDYVTLKAVKTVNG